MTDERHEPIIQPGSNMCACGLPVRDEIAHPYSPPPSEYPHISEEKPTALFLTQQEWDDLSVIADQYLRRMTYPPSGPITRRKELARRIIEANQ